MTDLQHTVNRTAGAILTKRIICQRFKHINSEIKTCSVFMEANIENIQNYFTHR